MISPVDDAKDAAHSVQDSRAYRVLVRGGLVAFGVVHFLVGVLALRVAMGDGGEEASQRGALRTLAQNPVGPWLLGAVALGLFVIALWQLITAFVGHRQFDGAKRVAKRLSSVLRTILYAFLGYQALQIALFGGSSKQGDEGEESVTASLLALPFGGAVVALVGLGIVGYGVYQIVTQGASFRHCTVISRGGVSLGDGAERVEDVLVRDRSRVLAGARGRGVVRGSVLVHRRDGGPVAVCGRGCEAGARRLHIGLCEAERGSERDHAREEVGVCGRRDNRGRRWGSHRG